MNNKNVYKEMFEASEESRAAAELIAEGKERLWIEAYTALLNTKTGEDSAWKESNAALLAIIADRDQDVSMLKETIKKQAAQIDEIIKSVTPRAPRKEAKCKLTK